MAGKYLTLTAHGFILKTEYANYQSKQAQSILTLRTQAVTPKKPNIVLFFPPLIFIMYDPCLHILIAQAAPYAHAISVFFLCAEA